MTMELAEIAKTMARISKERFDIVLPLDRIRFYEEDKKAYLEKVERDLLRIADSQSESERAKWFEEQMAEVEACSGFCTPNIFKLKGVWAPKLGHNIHIFTESSSDEATKQYQRVNILAHELGHAVMDTYRKKGFLEARAEINLAKVNGPLDDAYTEIRRIATLDEISLLGAEYIPLKIRMNKEENETEDKKKVREIFNKGQEEIEKTRDVNLSVPRARSIYDVRRN